MHLYELADEAVALDALCAMDEGEWTDEHEQLAQELAGKLAAKADAFGGYLKTLEARASAIKGEEVRLATRRKAVENHVQRLKTYALIALEHMGKQKVEGTLFTLTMAKNPPSVKVHVAASDLSDEYVRVIPESREPDKQKLLTALKAGHEIAGVELVQGTSLRVR